MVELTIVLFITGLLLTAILNVIQPYINFFREKQTVEQTQQIADALSAFALSNYRLPCPAEPNLTPTEVNGGGAEPFGYEDGSGPNGAGFHVDDAGSDDLCDRREGIVPFKTLGLRRDMAIDAWGNYISYSISPAFSRNPFATPATPALVHDNCRTREWLYETISNSNLANRFSNYNPLKARFCCPGEPQDITNASTGDIVMLDQFGQRFIPMRHPGVVQGPNDGYGAVNVLMRPVHQSETYTSTISNLGGTPTNFNDDSPASMRDDNRLDPEDGLYLVVSQVPPAYARSAVVAYALISHGRNGEGAFNVNTSARTGFTAGTQEAENVDGDLTYRDQFEKNLITGNAYFDDIVLWKTQDKMFFDNGESCQVP